MHFGGHGRSGTRPQSVDDGWELHKAVTSRTGVTMPAGRQGRLDTGESLPQVALRHDC